jgi:hypothetical protein
LAEIIERELLQSTREKQALLKTLADLDSRIEGQEQAAVNLKNLYDYCRKVEEEPATFEFDEQRLAIEALEGEDDEATLCPVATHLFSWDCLLIRARGDMA